MVKWNNINSKHIFCIGRHYFFRDNYFLDILRNEAFKYISKKQQSIGRWRFG